MHAGAIHRRLYTLSYERAPVVTVTYQCLYCLEVELRPDRSLIAITRCSIVFYPAAVAHSRLFAIHTFTAAYMARWVHAIRVSDICVKI